ncbi:hypothetical protein DPMN_047718 [Dreissena polymorpha]|uniref:Uncharacterized protein n=1 Tax=Dreissena polymorpha TaxID=45954 RepID=A0A9D4D9C7_DREPO|nr:hypothetical protein DPMN_047718 [Dreissena polymorpha]
MTLAPSWSPQPIVEVAIIEDTDEEVAYVTEDAGVTFTFTEVDDATEKVVEGDDVIEAADVTGVSYTEVTEDVERVEDTDVRETADVTGVSSVPTPRTTLHFMSFRYRFTPVKRSPCLSKNATRCIISTTPFLR